MFPFQHTNHVLDLRRKRRTAFRALRGSTRSHGDLSFAAGGPSNNEGGVELSSDPCSIARPSRESEAPGFAQTLVRPFAHMFALAAFVIAGGYVVYTLGPSLAYFSDTEGSTASAMSTGSLLVDAHGGGSFGLSCNDREELSVSVTLDGTRTSAYAIRAEFVPGTDNGFCEMLKLSAVQRGEERYAGDLLGFSLHDVTDASDWSFTVSADDLSVLPDGAMCGVALVFEAYCPALGYLGGGFTDRDAVMFTFVKEPCGGDESCDPGCCGNVDITIDQTVTNITNNTVVSGANSGGNTVVGGGTLVTGESGNVITIDGGTQSSVVDIDVACGCAECDPCADAQVSAEPISAAGTLFDETGETPHAGTASMETLIGSVREELAERLNGVRR